MNIDGRIVLDQDEEGDWLLPRALDGFLAIQFGGSELHHLIPEAGFDGTLCRTDANGRPERVRGIFPGPTLKLCRHCRDHALRELMARLA